MNKPEIRKAKSIKITTSGTVIKAPERVKTATGKVMATMIIQAESDKRSPYPLKLVAFDGANDLPERKSGYCYWSV